MYTFFFNVYKMSNQIENLKDKIEKIIELEQFESKINRINRIRIKK